MGIFQHFFGESIIGVRERAFLQKVIIVLDRWQQLCGIGISVAWSQPYQYVFSRGRVFPFAGEIK